MLFETHYKDTKRQVIDSLKIFSMLTCDKELVPRIYKECLQINNRKINNPVFKRQNI